jgi:hypothetical protein
MSVMVGGGCQWNEQMDKSRCKIPRTSLILVVEMNNDNTLLRGGNGLSL